MTGVTAVTSLVSCSIKQKPAEQKPLNIVYIMTDDHTAQMMSCYDTRYMETPNLDLSQYYLRNGCKDGSVPHIKSGTVYLVNIPALLRKLGVENDERQKENPPRW